MQSSLPHPTFGVLGMRHQRGGVPALVERLWQNPSLLCPIFILFHILLPRHCAFMNIGGLADSGGTVPPRVGQLWRSYMTPLQAHLSYVHVQISLLERHPPICSHTQGHCSHTPTTPRGQVPDKGHPTPQTLLTLITLAILKSAHMALPPLQKPQ